MAIKHSAGADTVGAYRSPQELKRAGFSSGVYKFDTPNGGVQNGYFLNCSGSSQGGDFGWVLVARWKGGTNSGQPNNDELALSFKSGLTSSRGMANIAIGDSSQFSADWGDYRPTEIRVMTYNNSNDILGSRGVDFIYKPGFFTNVGETWWQIMSNQQADDRNFYQYQPLENRGVNGSSNTKGGQKFQSARDGRGRWTNNSYQWMRNNDYNASSAAVISNGFITPTSNMWNPFNLTLDHKWSVSATDADSGQDTDSSAFVGWDDDRWAHYDANTGNVGENSERRDYNAGYCCTMWLR
jgi:hypothetical protein|tara:strand:+ start:1386 stop:2276 length:891 start_codon:yes stop_codon:yes gene_type:complete